MGSLESMGKTFQGKLSRENGKCSHLNLAQVWLNMMPTLLCSRCNGDGEHSCSDPPRCPDEVLDSLRRLESCRIKATGRAATGSAE